MFCCLHITGAFAQFNTSICQDDRSVIVQLFNWKWSNIADECERWLGPKGFCAVQVIMTSSGTTVLAFCIFPHCNNAIEI